MAASKELDVEFSELVTGYRLRNNTSGSYVDIYLYDSLASGAGYAESVAMQIHNILHGVRDLLQGCDCSSACHKCLKHYRNQYTHSMLDRHAALQLLDWGEKNVIASELTVPLQEDYLYPLKNILSISGCDLIFKPNAILTSARGKMKKLVVYPAMWKEPTSADTVFVSDLQIKYSKPYAVQRILEQV